MTTRKRRTWKRFTIATLLFLIFCSAGAFVGFRYGMSEGVDQQVQQRLADQQSIVYPRVYKVPDLLATDDTQSIEGLSLDALIAEIKSSTGRKWWERDEAPCTIAKVAPSSLVISASSSEHDQVVAYLNGRRKGLEHSSKR